MNEDLHGQRIEYRLSQAKESLLEADALLKQSLYRGTFNRAYYAMFYAFDQRQSSDYGEEWAVDQADAEKAITEAREFVDKIAKYIHSIKK